MKSFNDINLEAEKINRYTIEKIRIGVQQYMSPALLRNVELESVIDPALDSMVLRLRGYLWGNKVHKEVVEHLSYPKTWWDAFKLRWFPESWLIKWPAEYTYIDKTLHHIHVCPHINVDTPRHQPHLDFLITKDIQAYDNRPFSDTIH